MVVSRASQHALLRGPKTLTSPGLVEVLGGLVELPRGLEAGLELAHALKLGVEESGLSLGLGRLELYHRLPHVLGRGLGVLVELRG